MWKHSRVVAACCVALLALALQAQRQELPAGPMQEKAQAACLACHDGRIIVQQHLSRRAWTKSVDKMIRWGAQVAPEDREALIDYLIQNFGIEGTGAGAVYAREAQAELAGGAGAKVAWAACLGCHDADVVTELQLDERGWTRMVDKMVRWGAVVRPEDRASLLKYLATNYGPPKTTREQK
jgi:hypothetical protein